jgi:hypothetical protein
MSDEWNETANTGFSHVVDSDDTLTANYLPAGTYSVRIVGAEFKSKLKDTGKISYLTLPLLVTDGTYKGKKLFANVTVENPNEVARNIGKQTRNTIGVIAGRTSFESVEDFNGIECLVDVALKDDPKYGKQNNVTKWKKIETDEIPF